MHPTDDRSGRRLGFGLASVFIVMTVLAGFDLAYDFVEGLSLEHRVVGNCVLILGLLGLAITGKRLTQSVRRERQLKREAAAQALRWQTRESELKLETAALMGKLEVCSREADRWKREAGELLAGLGRAIDAQFDRWNLTGAERDIALLLLKGLSHKEIAAIRRVSEATVRQQAQGIYRKAGLSSRSDLAAFFLEDLLLPNEDTTAVIEQAH
jgi:DNA-binding CsgD family transcriptional regulator